MIMMHVLLITGGAISINEIISFRWTRRPVNLHWTIIRWFQQYIYLQNSPLFSWKWTPKLKGKVALELPLLLINITLVCITLLEIFVSCKVTNVRQSNIYHYRYTGYTKWFNMPNLRQVYDPPTFRMRSLIMPFQFPWASIVPTSLSSAS